MISSEFITLGENMKLSTSWHGRRSSRASGFVIPLWEIDVFRREIIEVQSGIHHSPTLTNCCVHCHSFLTAVVRIAEAQPAWNQQRTGWEP
jgi:hypothetical protein